MRSGSRRRFLESRVPSLFLLGRGRDAIPAMQVPPADRRNVSPGARLVFAADKTLWTLTPGAALTGPRCYLVDILCLEVESKKIWTDYTCFTLIAAPFRVQGRFRISEQGHLHLRNNHFGNSNYQPKLPCEYFMILFRPICLSLWRASLRKQLSIIHFCSTGSSELIGPAERLDGWYYRPERCSTLFVSS